MRVGISTGGGDCPGLNAVIRAVTRSSIINYCHEVIGIQDGFDGLLDISKTQALKLKDVEGIIGSGGTILGTTNRGNPFKYPVREAGKDVFKDLSEIVLDSIRRLKLDALIVVGGDGSLTIARDLWRLGAPIVGVPKTIDNDLLATDATIGYNTAVSIAVEAIDKLHTTAKSHHRAMVVEVMGRYAGWIALEAGISGAVDVILLPEIQFDLKKVYAHLQRRIESGKTYSIIVVAEGAVPAGGNHLIVEKAEESVSGVERLGGIGNWVSHCIQKETGIESRCVVLGHLQRGGSPSHADRLLATRFGTFAVELVNNKQFGKMASLKGKVVQSVDLDEAVERIRFVRPDSETVIAARLSGISFGD